MELFCYREEREGRRNIPPTYNFQKKKFKKFERGIFLWTYKKLYCKGDPTLQTDRHPVTFI